MSEFESCCYEDGIPVTVKYPGGNERTAPMHSQHGLAQANVMNVRNGVASEPTIPGYAKFLKRCRDERDSCLY